MNTGYDLNNPNKYMQSAFDAFKGNQPATQQAVSQGPQAGLRYLAGLQAQATQQQAQQGQAQSLPSTTVLQQLLQKLGQNHGIMAQLPSSIDVAAAPQEQPPMAMGGLVSLAAGGPITFSGGGGTDLGRDFYPEDYPPLTEEETIEWNARKAQQAKEAEQRAAEAAWQRKYGKPPTSTTPATPTVASTAAPELDADASYTDDPDLTNEDRMTRRNPEYEEWAEAEEARATSGGKPSGAGRTTGQSRLGVMAQKTSERLTKQLQPSGQGPLQQGAPKPQEEKLWKRTPKYQPPTAPEFTGPPRPTEPWTGEPIGARRGIMSTIGEGVGEIRKGIGRLAETPVARGMGKLLSGAGMVALAADPDFRAALHSPMLLAKMAAGEPINSDEIEDIKRASEGIKHKLGMESVRSGIEAIPGIGGVRKGIQGALEWAEDKVSPYMSFHDDPTRNASHEDHKPVQKAEPPAAAKQGANAMSPTAHVQKIVKKSEPPPSEPDEKKYNFDQHRREYRDDSQPQVQAQPVSMQEPAYRAPEETGIGAVTPEDMIQHLQQLGGGGYQEDPEIAQMRRDEYESAKANKWANSIAGLVGGIYGGHSPYASENVARGIMTAMGQYQAGTQAEDLARRSIISGSDEARKAQAATQQHWMDKFLEAQIAKGHDIKDIRREMMQGESDIAAAKVKAKEQAQYHSQKAAADAVRHTQNLDAKQKKALADAYQMGFKAIELAASPNVNRTGVLSPDAVKRIFMSTVHDILPEHVIPEEVLNGVLNYMQTAGASGDPSAPMGAPTNIIR